MSVSLVKITPATIVYVVGYAYGPYSPDPEHLTVCADITSAREALAYEMERAADQCAEMASDEFEDTASASIAASAEMVKSDRDGDVTYSVKRYAGWSTVEPDGYTYWIHAESLATVFGDNTDTAEYEDVIDALHGR